MPAAIMPGTTSSTAICAPVFHAPTLRGRSTQSRSACVSAPQLRHAPGRNLVAARASFCPRTYSDSSAVMLWSTSPSCCSRWCASVGPSPLDTYQGALLMYSGTCGLTILVESFASTSGGRSPRMRAAAMSRAAPRSEAMAMECEIK
jgi:hypothetical protein